jgi:hypothetical protein
MSRAATGRFLGDIGLLSRSERGYVCSGFVGAFARNVGFVPRPSLDSWPQTRVLANAATNARAWLYP